jgi:glycosyltransferase involved in cell wall biosynthesis
MNDPRRNVRIALLGDSLGGGGAEKVHAMLSRYFDAQGFEVCNCILIDEVCYDYGGTLVNLGKISGQGLRKRINKFRELRRFFTQPFDAVIDFRMRPGFLREFVLSRMALPKNTIYTVHSGILPYYFPQSITLSRILYKNRRIVAVSKALASLIKEQGRAVDVTHIYNPFVVNVIQDAEQPYILAVGRMNDQVKQFDKLIEAYASAGISDKIGLKFLGDGPQRKQLEMLADRLGLQLVSFEGFVPNVNSFYASAMFTVLCSTNEGFPNVLPESLAAGTPVVAFDCFSGPSEIVIHKHNGLLVADQDFPALAQGIGELANNDALRAQLRANARASISHLTLENVGKQWLDYLNLP